MGRFFKKFAGHFLPAEENAYRPHLLRKPWLLFFLTIVLTAEGLYIASLAAQESAFNFLSAVLPAEVIALTNAERTNVGEGGVVENAQLTAAAQHKANDMAQKGYFSHNGPDGKEPWAWIKEAGYNYRFAGENLAVRFDESSDVVRAWMASPTHRANIVKPAYTEIGIGVAQGIYEGAPATFVVQYFGSPAAAALVSTAEAPQSSGASLALPTSPAVAGAEVAGDESTHIATATESADRIRPTDTTQSQGEAQSSLREAAQTFLRASQASQDSINWIIGGVALFLALIVVLALVVHIEIQPTEMLLGGAFVGAVAVSLFMLNNSISQLHGVPQSASVAEALETHYSVVVDERAAAVEPAL